MMNSILTYLPPSNLLILFCLLNITRFENQRWMRARQAGLQGSSVLSGFLVDFIGFSSMIFYYVFLISFGFDNGLWSAILLFSIASLIGFASMIPMSSIFGGDNAIVWAISTVAIIPLQVILFSHVTWFGWFG